MIKRAIINQGLNKNARPQKLRGQGERQLAHLGLLPNHEWEEGLKALAAKRTIWDRMSSIIIRGKCNQFPILDVCKRRSKRIKSLKEKRQARYQEILPLHPSPPPPPSDRAGSSLSKVRATTSKKRATNSTKRQVWNKRKYGANSKRAAKVQACRRSTQVSVEPERFGPI